MNQALALKRKYPEVWKRVEMWVLDDLIDYVQNGAKLTPHLAKCIAGNSAYAAVLEVRDALRHGQEMQKTAKRKAK